MTTSFFVTPALPPRAPPRRADSASRRAVRTTCNAQPVEVQPPSTPTASPPRRARCPPKRPVEKHELKLLRIQPSQISFTDDSSQQTIFSAFIGLIASSVLLPPLFNPPPVVQTSVTAAVGLALAAWAVDTLSLKGALQKAGWLALQSRRRVARHEAAHILVAYLLSMRVQQFRMPSVLDTLRGQTGGAVILDRGADEYDTCAVAVAGTVAEIRAFGEAKGGVDDIEKALRIGGRWQVVYWGVLAADFLLREQKEAFDALVEEIVRGEQEVHALLRVVDQHVRLA